MKFQSTASYIIVTFFLFAIVISFAFTGFEGVGSAPNLVAQVGSQEVTAREYQNAFNSEVQRFSSLFGGKSLTAAQIRQFRLKEGTLNRLVDQKLMLNFANDMNIDVSEEEVKQDIKEAEYFQTGDRFDVNKYKSLLAANGYTPKSFEELTRETIKLRKVSALMEGLFPAKSSIQASQELKESTATVDAVVFDKEALAKYVEVSQSEIQEFITKPENENILKSVYNSMESQFNKPARVKASHVLIKSEGRTQAEALDKAKEIKKKLTTKNFAAVAGKETEDPSGKGPKGGSLGWFSKGRMVPEFEEAAFSMKPGEISQPIKTDYGYHVIYVQDKEEAQTKELAQVKETVAKAHLQKVNREKLKALQNQIKEKAANNLKSGSMKQLEKLANSYELKLTKEAQLNPLDGTVAGVELKAENVLEIINQKNTSKVFVEDKPSQVVVYKASKVRSKEDVKKALEKASTSGPVNLGTQVQQDLLTYLKGETKIVTYPKML